MENVFAGNPDDLTVDGCGGIVRAVRLEQGLSLGDVADRLGWHRSRLSKYETNRLGMNIETLAAISGAVGVTPEVMLKRILRELRPQILANPIGAALKPIIDRELRERKTTRAG